MNGDFLLGLALRVPGNLHAEILQICLQRIPPERPVWQGNPETRILSQGDLQKTLEQAAGILEDLAGLHSKGETEAPVRVFLSSENPADPKIHMQTVRKYLDSLKGLEILTPEALRKQAVEDFLRQGTAILEEILRNPPRRHSPEIQDLMTLGNPPERKPVP